MDNMHTPRHTTCSLTQTPNPSPFPSPIWLDTTPVNPHHPMAECTRLPKIPRPSRGDGVCTGPAHSSHIIPEFPLRSCSLKSHTHTYTSTHLRIYTPTSHTLTPIHVPSRVLSVPSLSTSTFSNAYVCIGKWSIFVWVNSHKSSNGTLHSPSPSLLPMGGEYV